MAGAFFKAASRGRVILGAPVPQIATVTDLDPFSVTIGFDQELRSYDSIGVARPMPAASSFTVTGTTVTAAFIGDFGYEVRLTLAAAQAAGATIAVGFTNPAGATQLKNYGGSAVANFSSFPIANGIVARTTLLLDDFTIKADNAAGVSAPQIGPTPINVGSFGGLTIQSGGGITNKPTVGTGSAIYWEMGTNTYTAQMLCDGSYDQILCPRWVDESNYMWIWISSGNVQLGSTIAGVRTQIFNAASQSLDNAVGLLLPKVSVTPTSIVAFDNAGNPILSLATTQFASSTRLGIKTNTNGSKVYNIKAVTPIIAAITAPNIQ